MSVTNWIPPYKVLVPACVSDPPSSVLFEIVSELTRLVCNIAGSYSNGVSAHAHRPEAQKYTAPEPGLRGCPTHPRRHAPARTQLITGTCTR